MNEPSTGLFASGIELPPGQRRTLSRDHGATLTYVLDGVLATDHPEPALRRVLRGELVLFGHDGAPTLRNGSRRDALRVTVLGGFGMMPTGAPPTARYFSEDDKAGRLCLMASPGGRDGSLPLDGPLHLYATQLAAGDTIVFEPKSPHVVVLVVAGEATAGRTALARDALTRLPVDGHVRLSCDRAAHLLLMDFETGHNDG